MTCCAVSMPPFRLIRSSRSRYGCHSPKDALWRWFTRWGECCILRSMIRTCRWTRKCRFQLHGVFAWSNSPRTELPAKLLRNLKWREIMAAFLLWCILFLLCWPIAILALVLYPIVWLILLPFRIVGIAVGGVLSFLSALFFLPVRLLRGPRAI